MHDLRGRHAHTLRAACQRGVVIVAGMVQQDVICHRALVFVQFNAHPHVVAIPVTLVHLFVYQIRLDDLHGDAVTQEFTLHDADEHLAITRHRRDNVVLHVNQAHLAVNSAVTNARELCPRILNKLVAENVDILVHVTRAHLQAEASLTNNIGAQ